MGALQEGRTPLFFAAHKGKEAVAQVLLQAGANKEEPATVRTRRGVEGRVEQSFEPFLEVSRGLATRRNFSAPA